MAVGFFRPDKGETGATPEQIERQRAVLDALLGRSFGQTPRTSARAECARNGFRHQGHAEARQQGRAEGAGVLCGARRPEKGNRLAAHRGWTASPSARPGRAIAERRASVGARRPHSGPDRHTAQLGQGDRRLAQDDAQFRAQHGLSVAEYERAGEQWRQTHGLNERQFEQRKAEFQADLAHRQAQLAEQRRQHDVPAAQPLPKEAQLYQFSQENPGFLDSPFASGGDALSHKVEALISTGLDQNAATSIAAGRYTVSRDPISGAAQVVDKATGQVVGQAPPEAAAIAEQAPSAPEGGGLYGQAPEATGVVSGAQELSSNTLGQLPGQVGDFFSFPDTIETRQAFRAATNDLIRAFSINPKYPVAEINRLRSELGVEPSAFEDPEAMQSRMRPIDGYLRNRLEIERRDADDPGVPPDQRKASMQTARAIEGYLGLLGVPQDGQAGGQEPPRITSPEQLENLPSGSEWIAPDGSRRVKP